MNKSQPGKARKHYNQWRTHTRESKIFLATMFALCAGVCPRCNINMTLSYAMPYSAYDHSATLDHTDPISKTMKHDKLNLAIMCRKCNTEKANN